MTRALAALLVIAACGAPQKAPSSAPLNSAPEGPRSERTEARTPLSLERVAVIGASVSAGFAAPRVAVAITDAMREPREILDVASVWMFRDVYTDGARQVDAAIVYAPTVTVALDFLFWYAYRSTDAAERMASLERGLAELARLSGPLALGDLPDMRGASEAILSPAAIPPPDELARMNARVHGWAAARPDTTILPLGAWSQLLAGDQRIELAPGETVEPRSLLFVDGLHVNALGLWWLLSRVDETLENELEADPEGLRFIR